MCVALTSFPMLTDKAPYFVTIVIAGLSWAITHIVDRVLAAPTIIYETKTADLGNSKRFDLTLKNATRDKTFRSLRLILAAAPGDTLRDASITPVQPAWEGDQPFRLVGRTFDFTFAEIQPGGQFFVSVVHSAPAAPSIRISSSTESVFLTKPSLSTALLQYELPILIILIVGGVLIVLVLAWFYRSP